jgi:hypothetical protein
MDKFPYGCAVRIIAPKSIHRGKIGIIIKKSRSGKQFMLLNIVKNKVYDPKCRRSRFEVLVTYAKSVVKIPKSGMTKKHRREVL